MRRRSKIRSSDERGNGAEPPRVRAPMSTTARVLEVVSACAAAVAGYGAWVWWSVLHSPGDDNPVGAVGFLALAIFAPLAVVAGLLSRKLARGRG